MFEVELKLLLRPPIPIEGDIKEFSKNRFYPVTLLYVLFKINLFKISFLCYLKLKLMGKA